MTDRRTIRAVASVLAAVIPVALTAWVYRPLLGGWFWADDLTNMASIANDGVLRFAFRPFGGHNLLTRNLVFAASFTLFGLHAEPWFWTVFLTHLLNVWLLFRLVRSLTASATLACLGATLWGTSPIVAASLEWYSVFGQVMLTTLLLVVLGRLATLARDGAPLPGRTAIAWYVLLLLGTTCFGVGLGVALAFPVALFTMLPSAWRRPGVRAAYLALPLVTIALYVGFRRLYPVLFEPLSFAEITTTPASIRDLPAVLAGVWNLLAFAGSEYARSFLAAAKRAYPDRTASVVLALVGTGLVVLLWRGGPFARRATVALASLSLGMYFAIALGRIHFTSPAKLPLQMRYHYVAGLPILVVLGLALQEIGRIGWLRRVPRALLLIVALAFVVRSYARSTFRVQQNAAARGAAMLALQSIAAAARTQPPGATVYLENGVASPVLLGPVMVDSDFPGRAALLLITQDDDVVEGRSVRFVERNPKILSRHRQRPESRLARLLVAPDAVPGWTAR